jgi:tetratricopeptide (TPR) repeat protein
MKTFKNKRLLSLSILLGVLFLIGTSSALSEGLQKKFLIPPSIQKKSVSKAKRVETGEEIPNWVARLELARVLSYAKRYDESITEYEKVLKEKPGLAEVKVEMAKVLFWKGDQKAAVQILEQVPPNDMKGDTKLLMADLLVARKDYAKAEPLYKTYLQNHPEDQAVRLKLAEMLSWQKKYDASLAEYRKILKARPDDIQVRRRYAFVLIWAGKHLEAASELQKTLH